MVPVVSCIDTSGLRADAAVSKHALFARARAALGPVRSAQDAAFFVPGRIEVLGKHTDYAGAGASSAQPNRDSASSLRRGATAGSPS